ncbi:MAG: hypothetical protein KAS66_08300 [Candidatus Omnitrophica bacterium]|nr:hypothetical protein [Candidatus Omnitrophota bacterium]
MVERLLIVIIILLVLGYSTMDSQEIIDPLENERERIDPVVSNEPDESEIRDIIWNTFTEAGFNIRGLSVEDGLVYINVYGVGEYTEHEKKQAITVMTENIHLTRMNSGETDPTIVYLRDEYGIDVASARYYPSLGRVSAIQVY